MYFKQKRKEFCFVFFKLPRTVPPQACKGQLCLRANTLLQKHCINENQAAHHKRLENRNAETGKKLNIPLEN